MRKRLTALLLALCLILSAAPVNAGAAYGQYVSASTVVVTAGNTAYVTLWAGNFENIAALDVEIYYDPAALTVADFYNGSMLSGAQVSVNTAQAGRITLSLMSLDGLSGSDALLYIYFSTKYDCAPGGYPLAVTVGRAYNGDLQPAEVSGVDGKVIVNERLETETFTLRGDISQYSLQKDDVLSYRVLNTGWLPFVSGEFTVTYDHGLFAFDSITLEPGLTGEGAIYSVNSSVLGQVRLAYANENPVANYVMFTVKLKVIADVDAETTLKVRAENIYREDLSAYLPGSNSGTVSLVKLPQVMDYPNAFLQTDRLVVGKQSNSVFCLEKDAGIAAADFTLTYDPAVLRCVSVTAAEGVDEKGGMIVVNESYGNGTIRFSYINMEAYDAEDLPLVQITWEPLQSPSSHYEVTSAAVGVVDAQQNPVTLEYVKATGCIYVATVTEPTCQEEGRIEYLCACGDADADVLPPTSDGNCVHYTVVFLNDDGEILSSREYHYGDAVTAPADPTKAADDTYTYTFAGWDKTVVSCAGDATYTATYTATPRKNVAVVKADSGDVAYKRLSDAILAADANSEIQLIGDVTQTITVSKDLCLDLNGFDLVGNVTATAGATLYVLDSQTDDYTVSDSNGYGRIIGTATGVRAWDGYVMLTETDGISFHRVELRITAMTLRASCAGVYFKCQFAGDEVIARNVDGYGVALSVDGVPTADAPGTCSRYEDFTTQNGVTVNSTLLEGIMHPMQSDEINEQHAAMPVYGRPYILTKDGQYIFGECVNRTFRQQVEMVDAMWPELTDVQKATVIDMYWSYYAVMDNWDIPNIKAAA